MKNSNSLPQGEGGTDREKALPDLAGQNYTAEADISELPDPDVSLSEAERKAIVSWVERAIEASLTWS